MSSYDQVLTKGEASVALVGFEASGVVHLGHYLVLSTLRRYLSRGCKGIVLVSDVHAKLNNKPEVEKNKVQMCRFFRSFMPEVQLRINSEFLEDPKYWDLFLEFAGVIRLRSCFRGLPMQMKSNQEILKIPFTRYLYPVLQCIDGIYVGANLLIAGKDQRNIYMEIYNNYHKLGWPKPSLHFVPLIDLKGQISDANSKMSSSKTRIPLDGALYEEILRYQRGELSRISELENSEIHLIFQKSSFQEFIETLKKDLEPIKEFVW